MKGSARLLCAALGVVVLIIGSHADKPTKNNKNIKKFQMKLHPNEKGPFGPVPLPPVPPFRFAPMMKTPSLALDPYACLPKYLCVVQNKKGERRTTIVHGLHPALRKTKPDVIDPLNLPNVPGLKRPFPRPHISTEGSDDDIFRDREFDDSFLKQQEVAEAMAFIEEKRRQFMYQSGLPKQTIIPKKKKKTEDKKSKESAEEEEEEGKSKEEELSKEDKEEEKSKEEEVSKEEKENDKSVEEKEEESAEEESSESSKSRSKLSKYKIKKKLYSQSRKDAFKTRMDSEEYDDIDTLNDHIVTVPWDDRVKNDSDPLKPSEIYDKLFGKVLPSFQLPTLPKIARNIPGMSYFTAADKEQVTTTTTNRPGLLKRMLMVATGSGSNRHDDRPMRRYRRDTDESDEDDDVKLTSNDAVIVKQIRDPERQCRMIFQGCDLPYEHIMKMVSSGQVLIENDQKPPTTTRKPALTHDDEYEQAMKDRMAQKKSPKPIPQLLAQASLGGKKKVKGPDGLPIFGKIKKRPASFESIEDFGGYDMKPKKSVASLPLRPMRYQWGKPTYTVNGKPTHSIGAPDFSGGIFDPNAFKKPVVQPTTTTTTTTERPIFAAIPLDPKNNQSAPITHSVIQVNKTHAVHVLSKKPYNPSRTRTLDAKGNPMSFSTVFTEIAGNTGGIHDFFDRISGAFGGDGQQSGRELTSTFPGSNTDIHGNIDPNLPASPHAKPTAFPSAPIPPDTFSKDSDDDDDATSAQRDDDESGESDEEEDEEGEGDEEEEEDDDNNDEEEEAADIVQEEGPEKEEQPTRKPDTYLETNPDSYLGVGSLGPVAKKKPGSYTVIKKHKPINQNIDEPEKNKKPVKDEEDDDEEAEDDVEEGEENQEAAEGEEEEQMDLPDNIPPMIKQSMIEDMKRKKAEAEKEGEDGEEDDENGQGPQQPGQPGGPQQFGGRPGQGHYPQHQHGGMGGPQQPQKQGGFLSSLFSG
ncbi:hypothetical protein Ocin01_12711 [Orchesella cincta]|uniref:Uncharacterized protein n=1 Tax=Orchesella cincta TaxID=48709 RepID=A0A1D2MLP5_ORCCI|nr:hypothetical protein Ocin01_12711 [Orchesella cincta]